MARIIDAEVIIDFIDMGHYRNPLETCFSERDVVDMLESAPTVDAVQVVWCRECKRSSYDEIFGNRWCNSHSGCRKVKDDDFCSYGERKDGDWNG